MNQARPSSVPRQQEPRRGEKAKHADAIVGHFDGNYFGHAQSEPREGFKVGEDFRDLIISKARRWYDGFL